MNNIQACIVRQNAPTSTGSQTVTGIVDARGNNFTPKLVIPISAVRTGTTDGFGVGNNFSIGGAVSSSSRFALNFCVTDAVVSQQKRTRSDNAKCISIVSSASGSVIADADFTSFASGQATFNWTTAGSAWEVAYLFLGGAGLSVAIEELSAPGTDQQTDQTGAGFEPDAIIFMTANTTGNGTSNVKAEGCYGFWARNGGMWHTAVHSDLSAHARSGAGSDYVAATQDGTGPYNLKVSVVRALSSGVRLDWEDASGSGDKIYAIYLKGGHWHCGNSASPSSAVNQQVHAGHAGIASLLLSNCKASNSGPVSGKRLAFGMAANGNSGAYHSTWQGETHGVTTAEADRSQERDELLQMVDSGSPSGVAEEANFDNGFFSNGFNLNWTTADATARAFGWLSVGHPHRGALLL